MVCREFQPSPFLKPYVKSYVVIEDNEGLIRKKPMFIYPSGHLELILSYGDEVVFSVKDRPHLSTGCGYLGGQIRGPVEYACMGRLKVFSVIFRPWGAFRIMNIPQNEFTEKRIDLDLLLRADVSLLTERLSELSAIEEKTRLVEEYLLCRLRETEMPPTIPRIAGAASVLENTEGRIDLANVAALLDVTVKTMERDFTRGIGIPPKEFARIVRFNKVLNALTGARGEGIQDLVHRFGYFDQSHLINEFREFTGTTPAVLLRETSSSRHPGETAEKEGGGAAGNGAVHASFRERVRI